MIGKTYSHYRIVEKLGEGGMGVVYKARDTHLDRFVALKILPAERVADSERKRRFVQEAKAASSLNHPHIVTIYDIVEADGIHFIAMECVEGKTLDQLIPRHGMRLKEALKIAVQIADALAAAHEAGIVHRDLKPGNLIVTDKGHLKVLDFGLAKLTEEMLPGAEDATLTAKPETEEGKIVGTVAYMSPEQAEGKKVDARSDIFSLGSVLYEMVSGKRPFEADSKASTLGAIIHKDPQPLSAKIPRDLEKVISRCLRKDIHRRFQHMDDVKIALEELKEESDSGVLEVAESPGVAVRGRLWWTGVLVAVAVAVTTLGIGGWFWVGRSHPAREETQLTAVPLTTYRGQELFPSLSPDGTQVAFQWCQEGQNCHIYIKQVGVEPPSQLTNAPMNDRSPAWSPDGRFIAFIRRLEPKKSALILIPQRGGSDRQLATWDLSEGSIPLDGPYLAWTPDSKWLAFPYMERNQQKAALFLISADTGEKRRLTVVPVDAQGDTAPAFSPDGRSLAFIRNMGNSSGLCLLRLGEGYRSQGEPDKVVTSNPLTVGAVWMPDGRELVISSGDFTNAALSRIQVSNRGKPVRLGFASDNATAPSISMTGKRLAYALGTFDSNIWRVNLEGPGRLPGTPVQLISSTKVEFCPAYSLDGKRIAFVSEQTGAPAVWICDSDGRNPVQLTSFGFTEVAGPRWSPDGQSIAFYGVARGNQDVYVMSAAGGAPQRLTTQPGVKAWPFWSRDGQWLYFKSVHHSPGEIWKIPSQGGEATQVTRSKEGADVPQESPDGKFLYYCRGYPFALSVWKIPIEGGEETKILDSVHPGALWSVRQEGIYYFAAPDAKGASDLCLLEFVSGKTRKLFRVDRKLKYGGVAVSPDGRTILYGQIDEAGSDLMLVENFQ
jgi:Tol biopolymer transport system component/tRNA A-37 threonylcarbamoyl transferase component Bud32